MMERRFARQIGSLEAIFAFVGEFFTAEGLDAAASFEVELIIEELFTNCVRHAAGRDEPVTLRLDREGSDVRLTVSDPGAEPFDPASAPAPDLSRPLEEREPGGLGIHLVRQLSHRLEHRHTNGCNVVTVTRRLEG